MNDVVAWLQSPEGEDWSRMNIQQAHRYSGRELGMSGSGGNPLVMQRVTSREDYGYAPGFFSIKADG